MASLFTNAVASIRMGIEDYRQQDQDRDISAVRNFYAGVLLLAKEALIRAAPAADPMLVIGARIKPVPDGTGGISLQQIGHTTIDFQQIAERAKDFGVSIDHQALRQLNSLRNDIEHHYTNQTSNAIRAAISAGFPVVASLFRQMDESPVAHLGEAWAIMLQTKETYDQELASARATTESIRWNSGLIDNHKIACTECGSEIVQQNDPDNDDQVSAQLSCVTCGASLDTGEIIENIIERMYGADAYLRYKEAFEDGPIYRCPCCERDTLVEGENSCANCAEPIDYTDECIRCGNGISLQDYLDGLDSGLCSYCAWQADKLARED